jgi:hypothetical protein
MLKFLESIGSKSLLLDIDRLDKEVPGGNLSPEPE